MLDQLKGAIGAGKAVVWAFGKVVPKDARGEAEVFHLHPPQGISEARADIVFVHGIGGDCRYSWTDEKGFFWPPHLGDVAKLRDCRILSVDYPTSLHALDAVRELALEERAQNVRDKLKHAGVGERPYILVCHSMGGLLAKQVLVSLAAARGTERLWTALWGIVFFATPHEGSEVAKLLEHAAGLVSAEARQLAEADWGPLDAMHQTFIANVKAARDESGSRRPHLHAFYEQFQTAVAVVSRKSATRDMDNGSDGGIPGDHETVCKPSKTSDAGFANTKQLLIEWLGDATESSTFETPEGSRLDCIVDRPAGLVMGGERREGARGAEHTVGGPAPRDRRWWLLAGAVVLAVLTGATYWWWPRSPVPDPRRWTYCASRIDDGNEWSITLRPPRSGSPATILDLRPIAGSGVSATFIESDDCALSEDRVRLVVIDECSLGTHEAHLSCGSR